MSQQALFAVLWDILSGTIAVILLHLHLAALRVTNKIFTTYFFFIIILLAGFKKKRDKYIICSVNTKSVIESDDILHVYNP